MNDEDRQAREDAIFKEERQKAADRQAERDFLKDRSIGGKDAPRPTDDFIDRSLGKDQNSMEQAAEAAEKTDRRMLDEDAKANRREMHERAERAQRKEKPSEKMKRKRDEKRDRGRGR